MLSINKVKVISPFFTRVIIKMVEFRFKLSNLPKYITPERVQTAAADLLGLQPTAIVARKRAHSDLAFVTVHHPSADSPPSTNSLLSLFNSSHIEGAKVIAVEDTYNHEKDGGKKNKKMRLKGPGMNKCLADQVTSLWRIPYQEQLVMKRTNMRKALEPLLSIVGDHGVVPEVLPSPVTTGYRNKVEYTFGVDRQGKPTVGLCLGGFLNGSNAVDSPTCDLLHIPTVLIALAEHVQSFMDQHPELPVWNVVSKTGFWRILLCRIHGDNQLMVGLQVSDDSQYDDSIALVSEHLEKFQHETIKIASFQVQKSAIAHSGLDMKKPFTVQFGSEFVEERLRDLHFKVSPLSFFQNNIPATLILYDLVKEYAEFGDNSDRILLDLCCGTGTIGMYAGRGYSRVIGVELVAVAIEDAKKNAVGNGLEEKCSYMCARVEDALPAILSEHSTQKLTVVLDPPRAGCANSVIAAVRRCAAVQRVVFVACEAALSVPNMTSLVRDDLEGKPFKLTRCQPVDLFPHTPHCELVLQFDRQ